VEQHVSKLQVAVCMEDHRFPTGLPTAFTPTCVTLLCSLCSKLKLDVPGLVETVTRPRLALAHRAQCAMRSCDSKGSPMSLSIFPLIREASSS
jgi:hypothetical protein